MADNEFIIVGPPRAMILFKRPDEVRPEDRQLINNVDVVGTWQDGYVLATCSKGKIPKLREAGATVIVLDPDANHFAATVRGMSESQVTSMISQRQEEAQRDLRIADEGRDSDDGEPA